MQTHYLRASSSHIHLDLRRMALAAPFWEGLRGEVGPVLGARLSACGVELAAMEHAYCQPEAGSTLEPEDGAGKIYDELEQKWVPALHESYSLPKS